MNKNLSQFLAKASRGRSHFLESIFFSKSLVPGRSDSTCVYVCVCTKLGGDKGGSERSWRRSGGKYDQNTMH